MNENAGRVPLPSVGEFRVRVARARAAANLSEAEFTRRLRDYGLDFRQENVAKIESGLQPMTLEEALIIGEVLDIEVPTSAGPIQAELANVSFAEDLDRTRKQWRQLVERLASLQEAIDDLVDSSTGIRLGYISDVKAAGATGDQKLLSLAQSLMERASATKNVLDVLQRELDDPDWSAGRDHPRRPGTQQRAVGQAGADHVMPAPSESL
jgi:transcriptional regulator with XRE-family HTH domain